MNRNRIFALATAICASTMLSAPSRASLVAPNTFTFTGNCDDCSNATATLVNYGTTINATNFVSFTYSSSILSFTITQSSRGLLSGDLSGNAGPKTTSIEGFGDYILYNNTLFPLTTYTFTSSSTGTFNVYRNNNDDDKGRTHIWGNGLLPASAPEPATWAMMVLGFGAVGGAMRRRMRTSVTFA